MFALLRGHRRASLVAAGSAAIAALLVVGVAYVGASQPPLTGTSLGKHDVAPDFTLHDSEGHSYSLSQFRGKVVVLTFLYTHCPDVCPLTAELLRHVDALVGHRANVVYLAVSVDPAGDTPESVAQFTEEHHLAELGDRWHYLVGEAADLPSVWQHYYIRDPEPPIAGEPVDHASAIYLIDKRGDRRVLTHVDTPPEAMARDLRILAGQ
ncbi:MAG: SCO family protein [Dehalococcoidia bacterium]